MFLGTDDAPHLHAELLMQGFSSIVEEVIGNGSPWQVEFPEVLVARSAGSSDCGRAMAALPTLMEATFGEECDLGLAAAPSWIQIAAVLDQSADHGWAGTGTQAGELAEKAATWLR